MADNRPVPGRRGRRAKNCGKKKTSETAASSKVEADNNADKVHDKTSNGTNKSPTGDNNDAVSGKSGVDGKVVDGADTGKSKSSAEDGELSVSDKTHHQSDATSDVEKNEPTRDVAKDRRCTSVPAGHSRYTVTTAYFYLTVNMKIVLKDKVRNRNKTVVIYGTGWHC